MSACCGWCDRKRQCLLVCAQTLACHHSLRSHQTPHSSHDAATQRLLVHQSVPAMGRQERQEAKKEREVSAKDAAKSKKAKEIEEAAWADAGPSKGKGAMKKEEEERKKAEAAARKAEAKKLLEEEEARLTASKAKKLTPAAPKVTKYELDKTKEEEAKEKEAALKEKMLAAKREMTEDAYAELVATENANRLAEEAAARNVAEALSALGVKEAAEADKHPEKRMRAAWLAYEERMMPEVKEEKPGLKMSQYRDMLWKMWQKAPENPMNQAASSGR